MNALRQVIITAPEQLREHLAGHSAKALVDTCAKLRPGDLSEPTQGAKQALRRLARRCQMLAEEITDADADLTALITQTAPHLIEQFGVGPEVAGQLLITAGDNPTRLRSEASFAALCGASPLPASSGRTNRHRLNRGGDRVANSALHRSSSSGCATTSPPATTSNTAPPKASPNATSFAASSATSPANSYPRSAKHSPALPEAPTDRRLTIYRSFRSDPVFLGGAEGIRTPDLLIANDHGVPVHLVLPLGTHCMRCIDALRLRRGGTPGVRDGDDNYSLPTRHSPTNPAAMFAPAKV